MRNHFIAFWNVENLFGPEDHPPRIEWIKDRVAADLRGWTPELYRQKLDQLARIIAQMNGGAGPDIIGVCEIEDRFVLNDLTERIGALIAGRDYGVVHADNEHDKRGIDTAFLYDRTMYSIDPALIFNHFVIRRTGTRDILQVTFHSTAGNDLILLCNHWPSRTGGTVESAGFRATAGETMGYWHERIRQEVGDRACVLAMGDFNDDPWDGSVKYNANSGRERGDVERALSAQFYNFAWDYMVTEVTDHRGRRRVLNGTLYFAGDGNIFDQIMASRPMLDAGAAPFKVVTGTARIEAYPEMVSHSSGEGPRRFGLPKGNAPANVDPTGYSDHFPVSIVLSEADGANS